MNTAQQKFLAERESEIANQSADQKLGNLTRNWLLASLAKKYSYHFEWMGRPIIQYPQDMIAMQELLWRVKPDIVVETGIAHGGSLIYYASILELIGNGSVLGIDIDIRPHNREAIETHPMFKRIRIIEGSSTASEVVRQVKDSVAGKSVFAVLDSNHTHEHVRAELEHYAPLVSVGSYCVVMDTVIEDMPDSLLADRPWSHGNNPMTAVLDYLASHSEFEVDKAIEGKLLITTAPSGYLKRNR
jgi:cephalosporin hydroxylase